MPGGFVHSNKLNKFVLFMTLSAIGSFASANQKQQIQPENIYHLSHQHGANQGFYSLGMGYKKDGFEPNVSFGYSPSYQGSAAISQLNFKFNWLIHRHKKPRKFEILTGFSLLMNSSPYTYFNIPKPYPNKYYPPNAYFFALQTVFRHYNFYLEISMLDYYFEVLARNSPGTMRSGDLLSVGFGYVQDIDFQWSEIGDQISKIF